jgi:hypothetical protein
VSLHRYDCGRPTTAAPLPIEIVYVANIDVFIGVFSEREYGSFTRQECRELEKVANAELSRNWPASGFQEAEQFVLVVSTEAAGPILKALNTRRQTAA